MSTPSLDELLRLHYVAPLPLPRVLSLLELDPSLGHLDSLDPSALARATHIRPAKIPALLSRWRRAGGGELGARYKSAGIEVLSYLDPAYPPSLYSLYNAPALLYAKGDLSILSQRKIAVIGSRRATSYTEAALQLLIPPLASHRFAIVSGLAKGADALAHRAAMRYGARTIGVLGSGFFHFYPAENSALAEEMAKDHLLLTEYPPHFSPQKWHFPMRNRIISGLSEALVVTEASLRSGTMSTTDFALEAGKPVFAVPGSITSSLSEGPHTLIEQGAAPVWHGYQLLSQLAPSVPPPAS